MRTRPCRSLGQIVSSKLLKTKNEQNEENGHQCCDVFAAAMVAELLIQSASRRLWPSSWQFLSQTVVPGPIYVQGWCRSTRRHLAVHTVTSVQDIKRRRRLKDSRLPTLFAMKHPSGHFSLSQRAVRTGWHLVVRVQRKDELRLGCPSDRLRSLPTSSLVRWTAAKWMSESAGIRPQKVPKYCSF